MTLLKISDLYLECKPAERTATETILATISCRNVRNSNSNGDSKFQSCPSTRDHWVLRIDKIRNFRRGTPAKTRTVFGSYLESQFGNDSNSFRSPRKWHPSVIVSIGGRTNCEILALGERNSPRDQQQDRFGGFEQADLESELHFFFSSSLFLLNLCLAYSRTE